MLLGVYQADARKQVHRLRVARPDRISTMKKALLPLLKPAGVIREEGRRKRKEKKKREREKRKKKKRRKKEKEMLTSIRLQNISAISRSTRSLERRRGVYLALALAQHAIRVESFFIHASLLRTYNLIRVRINVTSKETHCPILTDR